MDIPDFNPIIVPEKRYLGKDRYFVIRDDTLIGGTKQRALYNHLIKFKSIRPDVTELVYAGPDSGYAQIALAYIAPYAGFQSRLFLQSVAKTPNKLTKRAIGYGANYTLIQNDLKTVTAKAQTYVEENPTSHLIPFGLDSKEFESELVAALTIALKDVPEPKTLWLPIGSGTLLKCISQVWPNTSIKGVIVGRDIYWEDYDPALRKRVEIYDAKSYNRRRYPGTGGYKFTQAIDKSLLPPYPSLATYDGKIWLFASQELEDGDYIWNVGKD